MTKFCPKCQAETERNKSGNCKPCVKAYSAAWYLANIERKKTSRTAWNIANSERKKQAESAWIKLNSERKKANDAASYAANRENRKKKGIVWRAANAEAIRIKNQNYQAKKRLNGGILSKGLAAKLFNLQKGKCPCCKQPLGNNYHLDHIVPISLGGSNTDDNIQLLRQRCNNQKSAKDPIDFMQQRGFLL